MQNDDLHDVVIVGGGPAGLSAAVYSGRALLSTLLVEKVIPGGQLNETEFIENFLGFEEKTLAADLMQEARKQAERLGTKIVIDEIEKLEQTADYYILKAGKNEYKARSVIIASGSRPRELPAEGAKRLKGKGLSYCATCDAYFFQGKDILEVGAGDSGLTEAIFLTKFVNSVGIVVRHEETDPSALRASPILQKRAKENPKIHFMWNKVVEEVLGEERLAGVNLKDMSSGETEEMKTDGLFVNIGWIPETGFLKGTLDLDERGYLTTDDRLRTNLPGVFAAGDVRTVAARYAQAIIAAGDGAIAAMEAEKYLS